MIPMIFAGLLFTGCKKDEPNTPPAGINTVDVEFQIMETDFQNLKGSDADVPVCSDLPMDYVKFTFGDVEYTSNVFVANGILVTQVVRIELGQNVPSQTLNLTNFVIYNDVLPMGPGSEDIIVRAAPAPNSLYWNLMEHPLNISVDVDAFVKKQITVDVLCFEDLFYDNFGFTWFNPNLVKIERQCWFGDICTGKLDQYEGSLYEDQSEGLQMDMPAIMKIDVSKKLNQNDSYVLVRSFENKYVPDALGNPTDVLWLGEGDCMEVFWANDEDLTEYFKFDLYVWLPVGTGMDWVPLDTWEFTDGNCPDPGNDNVNDFVVGYCQLGNVDYTYTPYQNLPLGPITMTVGPKYGNNSTTGGYVDLSFIASEVDGTDLDVDGVSVFPGWCGDKASEIYVNDDYIVTVIGSMNAVDPVLAIIGSNELGSVNWLFNHLNDYYPGINVLNIESSYPTAAMAIQNAIWALIGDIGAPGTGADYYDMYMDAKDHGSFKPMPGEYAGVYFYAGIGANGKLLQTLFVQVDP